MEIGLYLPNEGRRTCVTIINEREVTFTFAISSPDEFLSFSSSRQRRQRLSNIGETSWPNGKYVTDTHRALISTCRHSLKLKGRSG